MFLVFVLMISWYRPCIPSRGGSSSAFFSCSSCSGVSLPPWPCNSCRSLRSYSERAFDLGRVVVWIGWKTALPAALFVAGAMRLGTWSKES